MLGIYVCCCFTCTAFALQLLMIFLLIVQMTTCTVRLVEMSGCGSSKRERKGTVPHKNWKGSESLAKVTKTAMTIEEESGAAGEKGVEFTRTDVKDKPHTSP